MAIERGATDVNGARLAYECSGDGPAVAFIHGFTLDRRMWDDQFALFSERHRALRHDLRGFGESSLPITSEAYTHGADLAALLDRLGIERVVLVALSMGGWIAIEFAQTYPERVSALVLVDSTVRGFEYGPVQGATLPAWARGPPGRGESGVASGAAIRLFARLAHGQGAAGRDGRRLLWLAPAPRRSSPNARTAVDPAPRRDRGAGAGHGRRA